MGATVITGKSASAYRAADGEVVYVLFEQTYEKNCYPHTPTWHCLSIGRIESVVKQIFAQAAACEGGMLQGRGGGLTPEGYIRGWLAQLRRPRVFHAAGRSVRLKVDGSFHATVPSESAAKAFEALERIGRNDIADKLRAGESVSVRLDEDVDVVDALYGPPRTLAAWRVVSTFGIGTLADEALGYQPHKAMKFDVETPEARQFGEHRYLLKGADGTWYCGGWAYFIVGSYIRSLAELELREPGSYNKRIKAYRNAILQAPPVPTGVKVVVDERVELNNTFARREVTKFAEKYPVRRTASGYEVVLDDIREDPTAMYQIGNLPAECMRWFIPSTGNGEGEQQQPELFAA